MSEDALVEAVWEDEVPANPGKALQVVVSRARSQTRPDAVVRTATADDYAAGQRLYGNVEGEMLWTLDKAANGHPLQSNLWARLIRT